MTDLTTLMTCFVFINILPFLAQRLFRGNMGFLVFLSPLSYLLIGSLFLLATPSLNFQDQYFLPIKMQLVKILPFLGFIVSVLDRSDGEEKSKNSVLTSLIFVSSNFFLGASDFFVLILAFELMITLVLCLLLLQKGQIDHSKVFKMLLFNFLALAFSLLGVALFYLSTKGPGFNYFFIRNHSLYTLSLAIFIVYYFFKIGSFPLHSFLKEVFLESGIHTFAAYFLLAYLPFSFNFTMIVQNLIAECVPDVQQAFVKIVTFFVVINCSFGMVKSFFGEERRRILYFTHFTQISTLMLASCLGFLSEWESHFLSFLVLFYIVLAGLLVLLEHMGERSSRSMKLSYFILAINHIGFPFSLLFYLKIFLLSAFVREEYYFSAAIIILFSFFNFYPLFKIIVPQLNVSRDSTVEIYPSIKKMDIQSKMILMAIILIILLGAFYPTSFVWNILI